jgi:hypothetical protein
MTFLRVDSCGHGCAGINDDVYRTLQPLPLYISTLHTHSASIGCLDLLTATSNVAKRPAVIIHTQQK